MKIRLGIDVACRAAHQASCADGRGEMLWAGRRFRTDPDDLEGLWARLPADAEVMVIDAEGGHTRLVYRNLPADDADTADGWPDGRTIPHISDLESLVEPNGNDVTVEGEWTWTFDHEAATGNLLSVTEPENNTTVHTYDTHGQLATSTDPNGNQTSYAAYDPSGLPTQVIDAEGGVSRFAYDADGLVQSQQTPLHEGVQVEDPSWARTEFFYDSFGRLGLQSSPKDARREPGELIWSAAAYDPNDNLTSTSDPAFGREFTGGPQWRTDFDVMDRPVRSTSPNTEADPDGARVETDYDAAGRPTVVRQPEAVLTGDGQGWTVFYDYDPLDRVVRTSRFEVTANQVDPQAIRTYSCYDIAGDLVAVVAPNAEAETVDCAAPPAGHTSSFVYDAAHRPVSATDADGHTTSSTYDANGNVTAATDPEGATTSYRYDQRGLVTRIDSPFDADRTVTEVFGYDAAGNRTLAVSPRGFDAAGGAAPFTDHVTRTTYDGLHRPVRVELPSDAAERTAGQAPAFVHRLYDAAGRAVASSQPTLTADPALVGDDELTRVDYFDPGWVRRSDDPGDPRVVIRYEHTAQGWQTGRTPVDAATGADITDEWECQSDLAPL